MPAYYSAEEIPAGHFAGGNKLVNNEDLRDILNRMKRPGVGAATASTSAAMTALTAARRYPNMRAVVAGNKYYWHSTSALTADGLLVIAADDAPALGRWLLEPGQEALLSMAFTYATADTTALLTMPAGALLIPRDLWWTISADFTGGSSSAIGVSATVGPTTQGDLLGGATGDVAADLEAADSPTFGTIGALWDSVAERRIFLAPATVLRFDAITSAFTAGAGTVEMLARVVANAGA